MRLSLVLHAALLLALSALALGPAAATAQERPQVRPQERSAVRPDTLGAVTLTLGDAVRLALTRSLDLARAGYAVDLRDLDRRSAAAAGDPELTLSGGPTVRAARGYETDFFGIPDSLGAPSAVLRTGSDVSVGVTAGVQLSLPLIDGGARRAARQAAERVLAASRRDRDRTAETVANEAAQRYVQVLQAAALVAVEDTTLASDRALLARVQAEYDVGNRNVGDVLQQQAAIAQSEQRLATARRNEAVARLSLRQALRLPTGTPLALAPAPDRLLPLDAGTLDVDALVRAALATRADLDAQAQLLEAARFDVRGARAGRAPTLSLGSSAGTAYSSLDDNRGGAGQVFDVNPNTSVGLTLSVPLLDQGRTRRNVARAELQLADADAVLELQRLRVAAEVETAVLDVREAAARLAAATEGVAAAREALAATEARYGVGAGIFLDVLDARRTLVQAETNVATARFDLLLGQLAVAFQTGRLGDALVALD